MHGGAPQRVCFKYQKTGNCRFGSSCRFVHSNGTSQDSSAPKSERRRSAETVAVSPYTLEALETQLADKLTSGGFFTGHSDALVCFWGGQDHLEVLWKGFLIPQDGQPWTLHSQTQVLNFVNSGLHALTKENLAAQFVRELGKADGRGLAVLKELFDAEYSNDAGRKRDLVSFQRGLVPLVTMLTMRRMEMVSQHMTEANHVYSFVRTVHVQLFGTYLEALEQIVESHSIEDRVLPHASFLRESQGRKYAPLCFTQVCLPFIHLLYLLGNKFQDIIYEESFRKTVEYVDQLITQWMEDGNLGYEHGSDSPLDSDLCFKSMKEEVMRLNKMIRRGERSIQRAAVLRKKAKQSRRYDLDPYNSSTDPWDVLEVGIPGEAVFADGNVGPRHDNDHRDISDIQLLPTTEECLSHEPPLLPGNYPFHENAHWLPPGPERWVDTHFRLFREDLCGTIRMCLQDLERRLNETRGNLAGGRLRDADVDYNAYSITKTDMPLKHTFSRGERDRDRRVQRHGLCIDVNFLQPSRADIAGKNKAAKKTKNDTKARRELWDKTGRLPFNGMVALVKYSNGSLEVVFCQIVERDLDRLAGDEAGVTLQPLESDDFITLDRWQRPAIIRPDQRHNASVMLLLEFNKIFFVAYEPVLRALQSLQPATMPFLEYLAPEIIPIPGNVRMESPIYTLARGFSFDLSSVVVNHPRHTGDLPGRLRLYPLEETSRVECEATLVRHSTLERDQARALVQALSSRVACIQGLPGSGKSFIGALLTRIIVEAKVSPVLIVCYTNHALDQFLCHLLDVGITSLVRIGGQCKEPRLEKYNLNNLPRSFARYELKLLYDKLDENADAIMSALRSLDADGRPSWGTLRWYLETHHPDEYDYFAERSAELFEDEWEVAGCDDVIDYWIQGLDSASSQRRGLRCMNRNVWTWSLTERQAALAEWIGTMRADRVDELVAAQNAYHETMKKLETVKDQADVAMLLRVQIIGMTTTGVAKNQKKIAAVVPRVVICEEAGEVLEAQLMACLSPACQQLVLIGDHKQLRPHIADYNLSVDSAIGKRFALDVSMFERLVARSSGLPFWMLTEQHRMRPQISQLLRMLFYPEVRDASETKEYPPLLGVDKNVFFVNHSHPEDGASGVLGTPARSHSNTYEVAYLVATLRYLLQQGYRTSDIAILTPYVGQLLKLRSALRGEFVLELNELDITEIQRAYNDDGGEEDEDNFYPTLLEEIRNDNAASLGATKRELSSVIRAATVDNFQGEEATVILVSLVRSSTNNHARGSIGFLKTPNRINVLLSRAKHGLILVGHGDLLREKSPLWQTVLTSLQSDDCYGNGLPLHCQRHPDDRRIAPAPEAFALLAPDGGCLRPCGMRLPRCGHVCPKLCHTDQAFHTSVYCTQPCPRLQVGCGHVCPGICGDPCGRCQVEIGTIVLPCGHKYKNARCWERREPGKLKCQVLVDKIVLSCGHLQRVTCSAKVVKCTKTCGAPLSCGHACSRKCCDCVERSLAVLEGEQEPDFPITPTEHGTCQKECERLLACCHRCRGVCHGNTACPPCNRICDVFRCAHGSCNHPCSDPCAACTEPCDWSCDHYGDCPLPCGAPCIRRLCDQRCPKSLECGHQCPSVCGEDCPSQEFCHECGDGDIKERVADVLLFQTYGEIDPTQDPVLVLPCCSMVYTITTLDGTLHMNIYYDSNGQLRGALPSEYIEMPQCPNCKKPIRGLRRYGRVTKRAAIDAAEKKFITHAQRQLNTLQERVNAATDHGDLTLDKSLHHDLRAFGAIVKRPPCQKAFEACIAVLTKAMGGRGGGDVVIDSSALPVPNSLFPYVGYFYLLSAQLSLLDARAQLNRAQSYASEAITHFVSGSFSQQAAEAKLLLAQILIRQADVKLNAAVKTEKERKTREREVEVVAAKANTLLEDLKKCVLSRHKHDIDLLFEKLQSVVRRARSATFYQSVSMEEMKAIKTAMRAEFRGSGHWYRCVNGHSYSIGECGMAMEQTRCPECGAPVGGANHSFVNGNDRDDQMEML